MATVVGDMLPGGELQLSYAAVRGVDMVVLRNLPACLGDAYRPYLERHSDKVWIVYEGEEYTFRTVREQMEALAAELSSFGIQRGGAVAIAMRNLPEFLVAFLAITSFGAVAVPLNALWKTEELRYSLNDSGAKILIADPERLQLCQGFLASLDIKAIVCRSKSAPADVLLWEDVLAAGKGKPIPSTAGVEAEDEAMIMYTSGSTGTPKGVVHTQRSVGTMLTLGSTTSKLIHVQEPCTLLAVPLFHITALGNVFLFSLPAGEKLIMMRKWDAEQALELIQHHKVKKMTGVPTMIRDILEHPKYSPEAVASLKALSAGGAPVPPSQVAKVRAKAKNSQPIQGYGLTETMGGCVINRGIDYLKRPSSCGKPIPFLVKVAIKDPVTGAVLQNGERGEVCLAGPLIMKGYHNKPAETAKAIDAEGYFHTGDIGKLEGNFLYILDRLKDIIIRGGENIDCSEVEAAIYSHAAVRECSVFGVPDARLGEVVAAAVWLREGQTVKAAELSSHVVALLAKFKAPEPENIFFHTQELPKGPTGKILKKELREIYARIVKQRTPNSKL